MVLAMSEEQVKAAAEEATEELKECVEEISEEDLEGVAGGVGFVGMGDGGGDIVPGLRLGTNKSEPFIPANY